MKTIKILVIGIVLRGLYNCAYPQENIGTFCIKGQVVNHKNQPLNSLWVIVKSNDKVIGKSLTDDDGKYSVEKLTPDSYKVYFSKYDDSKNSIDSTNLIMLSKDTTMVFTIHYFSTSRGG
jgi:hypothetical protein